MFTCVKILILYSFFPYSDPNHHQYCVYKMYLQNRANSENRHLVFLIFKKKQEKVFRLYSKDIVFGIKTKYHRRLRRFLVFFLNIRNTRCLFSEFVLFLRNMFYFVFCFQQLFSTDVGTTPKTIKVNFYLLLKISYWTYCVCEGLI